MKERSIIFSAPMVRAILAGTKTQTRRIMKPQPLDDAPELIAHLVPHGHYRWWNSECDEGEAWKCPYGQPGDRLWVREDYRFGNGFDHMPPRDVRATANVWYEAERGSGAQTWPAHVGKLRPGMFMPRWASRITLEVTGVRVERLQDISRGDAMDEGCPFQNMAAGPDPRDWYADLWDSINGPGTWDANPWVWVVNFARVLA